MEEKEKTKKTLKSKTKSNVINTNPQLPGVNEQGSAVAKDPIVEKVLSLSQRRKRALVMRKNEPKLERARKLAKNKFAGEKNLKARAEKAAIAVVRRKFAGQRGIEYATLSPSDKIMVDKLIDKKTALIKKIATRLYPKVRKAETERMASMHAQKVTPGGAAEVKKGALGASPLMQSVDMRGLLDAMLTEEMNAKMDKLLRMGLGDKDKLNQYRQALQDPDKAGKYVVLRKHLITMLDKLSKLVTDDPAMFQKSQAKLQKQRDYPSDKVAEALQNKSAKSGIPVSTLAEVFNRGYSAWDKSKKCNAEQYGFSRVNSFISGGKAYELDIDLAEAFWSQSFPHQGFEHKGKVIGAILKGDGQYYTKRRLNPDKKGGTTVSMKHKTREDAEKHLIAKSGLGEAKDPCWTGYKMVGMKKKNGKPVPNCVPEETSIETKPKAKEKTVKREIYTIPLKGADPQSMPEETMAKKLKKALKKC